MPVKAVRAVLAVIADDTSVRLAPVGSHLAVALISFSQTVIVGAFFKGIYSYRNLFYIYLPLNPSPS